MTQLTRLAQFPSNLSDLILRVEEGHEIRVPFPSIDLARVFRRSFYTYRQLLLKESKDLTNENYRHFERLHIASETVAVSLAHNTIELIFRNRHTTDIANEIEKALSALPPLPSHPEVVETPLSLTLNDLIERGNLNEQTGDPLDSLPLLDDD